MLIKKYTLNGIKLVDDKAYHLEDAEILKGATIQKNQKNGIDIFGIEKAREGSFYLCKIQFP